MSRKKEDDLFSDMTSIRKDLDDDDDSVEEGLFDDMLSLEDDLESEEKDLKNSAPSDRSSNKTGAQGSTTADDGLFDDMLSLEEDLQRDERSISSPKEDLPQIKKGRKKSRRSKFGPGQEEIENIFDEMPDLAEDLMDDTEIRRKTERTVSDISIKNEKKSESDLFEDMLSLEDDLEKDDRVLFKKDEGQDKPKKSKAKKSTSSEDDLFSGLDEL